jgi:hypothetical protein
MTACAWAALPRPSDPRWLIPREASPKAVAGLSVYHPVTARGFVGWEIARGIAALGGFRLLPTAEPPTSVTSLLERHVPPGGSFALARATDPSRFVALLLSADGRCAAAAKVATTDAGRAALAREAAALNDVATLLESPVRAPRVIAAEEDVLVLEAIAWKPRWRPWFLPEDVARSLGAYHRSGRANNGGTSGRAHGDFAPWNLLKTSSGWVLLDWENSVEVAPPFFDIFHFLVQAHSLLRHPSRRELVAGVAGWGWIGRALRAYGRAADVEGEAVRQLFAAYLSSSLRQLGSERRDHRAGASARRALLAELAL